jgi:hypothetical protein
MGLVDVQRELVRLCFAAQPGAFEGAGLLVYRDLVRERMLAQLRVALPRTCALLPEGRLERAFELHLAHEPPRTRFFRELVGCFVASALPLWRADAGLHPACCDMLRYELALWELLDCEELTGEPVQACTEFSFDKLPVASAALRLLAVSYAVHLPGEPQSSTQFLCLHRPSDGERPVTYTLTKVTHAFLQQLMRGEETLTQTVKRLASQAGATIDAAYLDALCETLAQFLERGILLGSR